MRDVTWFSTKKIAQKGRAYFSVYIKANNSALAKFLELKTWLDLKKIDKLAMILNSKLTSRNSPTSNHHWANNKVERTNTRSNFWVGHNFEIFLFFQKKFCTVMFSDCSGILLRRNRLKNSGIVLGIPNIEVSLWKWVQQVRFSAPPCIFIREDSLTV